jgi:hypothetical protein
MEFLLNRVSSTPPARPGPRPYIAAPFRIDVTFRTVFWLLRLAPALFVLLWSSGFIGMKLALLRIGYLSGEQLLRLCGGRIALVP